LKRFNLGIGSLSRALDHTGRHYDRRAARKGTLMRHFLRLTLTPGALPGGVTARAAMAQLVAFTGTAQGFTPTNFCAFVRAVAVTAIARTADTHLLGAAPATIEPIGLLACWHASPRGWHWTKPRSTGIKARQTCPYAREQAEGPGFFQERVRAFVYSASGYSIARVRVAPRWCGNDRHHIVIAAPICEWI
jgi:hypothetical protein